MRLIRPIKNINTTIRVPGSKSYTQRALITSSLADGRSVIKNALISEDTLHLIEALNLLGATFDREDQDLVVGGTGGKLVTPSSKLYLGNNGTGLRFLTGTICLGHGTFVLDGNSRMRQRPIQPLVDALTKMGVKALCVKETVAPRWRSGQQGFQGARQL